MRIGLLANTANHPEPDWDYLESEAVDSKGLSAATQGLAVDCAAEMHAIITQSEVLAGRNEGILRGLAVKSLKLLDRLASEADARRHDIEAIYVRLLLGSVATLGYLLKEGSPDAFDAYASKEFVALRKWEETLQAGSTEDEASERRILSRIQRIADLAEQDLRPRTESRWPNDEDLVRAVFNQVSYDFRYRASSAAVHSTFMDLVTNHVDPDNEWAALLEWTQSDGTLLLLLSLGNVSFVMNTYGEHVQAEHSMRTVGRAHMRLFDAWEIWYQRQANASG